MYMQMYMQLRKIKVYCTELRYLTVDESYWTDGYSLQKLARRTKNKTTQGENSLPTSVVPPFLQDVMEDVYVCGKSINLPRLIAPEVSNTSLNQYSSFQALRRCIYL